MKTLALILLGTIFALATVSEASKKKSTKSAPAKISTNVDFEARVVDGKYQYSTEAIATVENEKSLDDLIGVRKNFKDRLDNAKALR